MTINVTQSMSIQDFGATSQVQQNQQAQGNRPPPPPPPPSGSEEASLTEEQVTSLTELLQQFDSDNLSDNDIEQLHESIRELGVKPSQEFAQLLEDNGFSPEELRPQNGGQMPPMVVDTFV